MKRIIIEIALLIGLVIALSLSMKACSSEKAARKVAERNTEVMASDVRYYEAQNGKQVATIEGLELDINSLENINGDLYNDLSATKVKLKNAQSAIRVVTEYKYINTSDTLRVAVTDSVAVVDIRQDHLKLIATIDLVQGLILPGSLLIEIPNIQTIATEIKYRGWWIFRRKDGVSVTVLNSNPYIKSSDIFYVELGK